MNLQEIANLINEFDRLPKRTKQTTYLDICKYPRRRFEEICSRILCFYLAPKNEHGLNDLMLRCLLDVISPDNNIAYKNEHIRVINEENAEGKRLDILVQCSSFVLGIENKISASVYNPLEIYKNRIEQYGTDNIYKVVLSLRKITDKKELLLLKEHDFKNITYTDLFENLKLKIGKYINEANTKYITFLFDFIQTIENMSEQNLLNDKLAEFFFTRSDEIENLIVLHDKYKKQIAETQIERIAELREKIIDITDNRSWWAWEGWDLGISKLNITKPDIGIESYFSETRENALGKFNIFITSWSLAAWSYYEPKILKVFPHSFIEKKDDRAFLHLDIVDDNDEEKILAALKKYYDYLIELIKDDSEHQISPLIDVK